MFICFWVLSTFPFRIQTTHCLGSLAGMFFRRRMLFFSRTCNLYIYTHTLIYSGCVVFMVCSSRNSCVGQGLPLNFIVGLHPIMVELGMLHWKPGRRQGQSRGGTWVIGSTGLPLGMM